MEEPQKKAIDDHSIEITEVFELAIDEFLTFLRRRKVLSRSCIKAVKMQTTEQVDVLLEILKTKDSGWQVIIEFLTDNDHAHLAKKLKAATSATTRPNESKTFTKNDFTEEFKKTLAGYYRSQYSKVRTMFGCSRDVNEIWVPLKLEEKTKSPLQNDNVSHFELLKRLAGDESYSVALVKGHPGMGKTTLVQKIAYDWAAAKVGQFDLILIVLLRYVGKTADFLDLAADYYTNHLRVLPGCKEQLLEWLKVLDKKLLICFDGLDEYGSLAESPFKAMFQQLEAANKPCPIPLISCKLLITSRPYACEFINRDFSPLRFEISPLDEAHLTDFVHHYCETDEGKMKVWKYLKDHSGSVIKVPLILTFVCFLTDLREEIPTNLTFLYEKLLGHMLKREVLGNKLTEKVKTDQWKESAVVEWTAQLAFEGCKNDEFEFCPSLDLVVTKDSLTCGFLLHKFNFREERLIVEFPHRSLQEFFAALHCYHLSSKNHKTERNSVMKQIISHEDSQFGRFFLGLCSVEKKKFEEMLDWLNPTFGDALKDDSRIDYFLWKLTDSLSDCSEAELFGHKLAASLDQLETQIQKERESSFWNGRYLDLPLSNRTFQSALNLNGTAECWSISDVDKPRWSRLTCVYGDPSVDLREKIDRIQILFLYYGTYELEQTGMISSVELLPEVSTLMILAGFSSFTDLHVNFYLEYETSTTTNPTSTTTQLRHFCFQFDKDDIKLLKEKFKDQLDASGLIIGELHKFGEEQEISWVTVRVKKSYKRSHLLRMLIRLAIEIYFPPDDNSGKDSDKSSRCVVC